MGRANEATAQPNGQSLTGKWKKGVQVVLFSRLILIFILLALQIAIMLINWIIFGRIMTKFFAGGQTVFVLIVLVILINSPMDSSAKISWMLVSAIAPFFGAMFYVWTQLDFGHRKIGRSMDRLVDEAREKYPQDEKILRACRETDRETASLAGYLNRTGGFSLYENTQAVYFPLGEDKFAAMLEELEKAEHFIFLEYFIIDQGYMWDSILEILARKAKTGVEVRVMYDGMLEMGTLPRDFPKRLAALGIRCKPWARLTPIVTSAYNYRDHRKVLVIDGRVGFNGGINIADEYINRKVRYGHWKDTAVMLRGDGVKNLTLMFLQMWNVTEAVSEDFGKYLSVKQPPAVQSGCGGYVISYGDSPFDEYKVGEMVYMDILNTAEDYVYIMTPYLILDGEMETALKFAAERGVDVRLILPGVPDKLGVWALAKMHYRNLTKSGVKIFEYSPGFVHSKLFLSDDKKAVIGTINLDYRSLYHHFECATYMSGVPCIEDIRRDYAQTQALCRQVTQESIRHERLSLKLIGSVLKLIAPLL